jgi:hypothetical protein
MPIYRTPGDIAVALARNSRGNRIPWTPGQCFGLTINEEMSDACRIGPDSAPEGASPSLSGATLSATE